MTDAMNQEQLEQWLQQHIGRAGCSNLCVPVEDLRAFFAGRRLVQAGEVPITHRPELCAIPRFTLMAAMCAIKRGMGNNVSDGEDRIDEDHIKFLLDAINQIDNGGPAPTEPLQPASPDKEAWRPIKTAPKDGKPIIVFHPEGGVCEAFCPGDGFAWHCMDGVNTRIGEKSGKSLPTLTSFLLPPTHWMPLPTPPSDQVKT